MPVVDRTPTLALSLNIKERKGIKEVIL